jgi:hypothetical protein
MKDKGLYIIIAAVFFSPLVLLFYIEWYWVFLIYNVFWAAASYAAHSETKNPKISAKNAFLIPLVFNLIGFGYVAMKLNDDDDETVEPKSNDEVEAAKSRLRENILGTSKIEGYPDWVDVYRGDKGFNIELKKAIQKNVNENQSELINQIEKNNIIDSDNFWSHIEQSEILESFGLNKLFEDFSSEEYLKYAKNDEEAIEIEEKWQDEEYWIEMEFDAITIIDSKINELILNTQKFTELKKAKEKMFLEHEILNGSLTFWDEDYKNSIEIICELHSLKEQGKVWDDELNMWGNGYTEEIDSFYLTTVNDKKYRFDEDELCSFLNKEESPVFDSGSFSFNECGINDEDDNKTRQKKWDDYKAKFTQATSLEHFEINGYPNQEETKDEILNTKLKERKILSHQILTKGEFYYMLENETVSVFAQQHTLEKVIQEYEDEEWHTVDREFVDEFYLTDYEKGYRFQEVDLSKLIKIEESPDFESDGVSYDWCGIEEDDDNETRQKKWDDYKAKFPKAKSIEHFDIENKKS